MMMWAAVILLWGLHAIWGMPHATLLTDIYTTSVSKCALYAFAKAYNASFDNCQVSHSMSEHLIWWKIMADTCKLDQEMLLSRQLAMGSSQLQAAAGHTYLLMIHKPSSCFTQFAQFFPALFTYPTGLITFCSEAESPVLLCTDRT